MRFSYLLFIFLLHLNFSLAQKPAKFTDEMKTGMCLKIKDAARHAWKGYMEYAWGYDELKPVTLSPKNWHNMAMLITPVDAFDTFVLMDLKKEAGEAKNLVFTLNDFNLNNEVQVFEITIRVLGGLISAYELDGDPRFLRLATDLANRMMPAFNSQTGMPYRYVHLQTGNTRDSINNPAEIGTLMLEFGKLSRLTKNETYYRAAKKAIMAVFKKRSKINLVGEQINIHTGKWVSTPSHISGYIDSYYEYLYKSWILFGDKDFRDAFQIHQEAIKKYLIDSTANGIFMKQVNMHSGKETTTNYGALDAFYAGLCAYAGDVTSAIEMQKANYYMWTRFNLEPEQFNYKTDSLINAAYVLRPENIESCFYLYRVTGLYDYLWMSKTMTDDILENCKTIAGYTSLKNVLTLEKANSMESFFFAETLKYAYLVFAPSSVADLDKIVFNTEGHPFKIEAYKNGF